MDKRIDRLDHVSPYLCDLVIACKDSVDCIKLDSGALVRIGSSVFLRFVVSCCLAFFGTLGSAPIVNAYGTGYVDQLAKNLNDISVERSDLSRTGQIANSQASEERFQAATAEVHDTFFPLVVSSTNTKTYEVLHFQLNESAGATEFVDQSPLQNHGACTGDACPASGLVGKPGTFVHFDGANDIIRVPHTEAHNIGADESVTIEAWIYPQSNLCGYCRLVTKYDGNQGYNFDLADDHGNTRLSFHARDGSSSILVRSSENVLLNRWQHVAVVMDRKVNEVKLYVNGTETSYQTQSSPDVLRAVATGADLTIGRLPDENRAYQGMISELTVHKRVLSANEIAQHSDSANLPSTPWYTKWNSAQALVVFKGFNLEAENGRYLTEAEYGTLPLVANEGSAFDIPGQCQGCGGRVFTFSMSEDMETVRKALVSEMGAIADTHLLAMDNKLIQLNERVSAGVALEYSEANRLGMLKSILESPHNQVVQDFEPWQQYYPVDRGQQRDVATGRSQRTFDRWEGENQWLHGQATWLYQDPQSDRTAPSTFPLEYDGSPLDYYYHFHCEPDTGKAANEDCLNWQIYIELMTVDQTGTELANWARGGWARLTPREPSWEVFLAPSTFDGRCSADYIRANASDAVLRDPSRREPLVFTLPTVPSAWSASPEVCTVIFDSYLYLVDDVRDANFWRIMTVTHEKLFDASIGRYSIAAENLYFSALAGVEDDVVYQHWASEVYWMTQVLPQEPLKYGHEAFWWWTWPRPPEPNADHNIDPNWAPLQWCRLDPDSAPEGLGTLKCEAE